MNFIAIILSEIRKMTGAEKFLFLAMLVNLPLPQVFIPYATQGLTMIIVMLFVFNFHQTYKVENPNQSKKALFLGYPIPFAALLIVILVLQLIWIPYLSQLITIALLCSLYFVTRQIQAEAK